MNGRWTGWVLFGSVLMMIGGVFKAVSGVIGLFKNQWLLLGYDGYYLFDIPGLAIWWLIVGVILILGGLAAVQGKAWGLATGVVAAALAAISELFMIPIYPMWSIVMIVFYIIVLIAFLSWRPVPKD